MWLNKWIRNLHLYTLCIESTNWRWKMLQPNLQREAKYCIWAHSISYINTCGRKVTVYNDHKNLLLPYWRNPLKTTLLDSLYSEWFVESLDMKSNSSMLKAKISLLQMPWADLKRLTKTKARSNKRLKWPDLFTKIRSKLITSHLAEISEGTAQHMYWLTVCNPYIDLLGIMQTKLNFSVEILPYCSVKYALSFSSGIVFRNNRILVTAALQ